VQEPLRLAAALVALVGLVAGAGLAGAQPPAAAPDIPAAPAPAEPPAPPPSPLLSAQGQPVAAPAARPVTQTWWFWTAIGAVVLTSVAIVVLASRSPGAPGSRLGDMEAFRR
jgi:hypothetical protein